MSTSDNGECKSALPPNVKVREGDQPLAQPKSGESGTVRRELDQISRQLKGLGDRVKRLKEAV